MAGNHPREKKLANQDETGTLQHDKPFPCKQKQDNKLWISVVKE